MISIDFSRINKFIDRPQIQFSLMFYVQKGDLFALWYPLNTVNVLLMIEIKWILLLKKRIISFKS